MIGRSKYFSKVIKVSQACRKVNNLAVRPSTMLTKEDNAIKRICFTLRENESAKQWLSSQLFHDFQTCIRAVS